MMQKRFRCTYNDDGEQNFQLYRLGDLEVMRLVESFQRFKSWISVERVVLFEEEPERKWKRSENWRFRDESIDFYFFSSDSGSEW